MNPISPAAGLSRRARRRLVYALLLFFALLAAGTLGFHLLEGWSLPKSLYVTVTTIATVGYGDFHPTTGASRAFATVFMLLSIGTVGLLFSTVVQGVVQSEVLGTFGHRRRARVMKKLTDHYIVCGAGRVGQRIIRELERAHVPFVVIERETRLVAHLLDGGAHVIVGDATLEETLRDAGVEKARGLAACLSDDADNVYVVLTARGLSADLHIVSRAVEDQAEPKLLRAGANRVIAPTIIGSQRMVQALLRPAVHDFIDSVTTDSLDLNFDQVKIAPNSEYAGHKLRFTNIRSELDVVIVAVRRADGDMIFNPSGDVKLEGGDLLIAIGRAEQLARLKESARGGTGVLPPHPLVSE
ncbi:MAG: potassium channel protein [Acidobacteria bacterium]|nr:potassium channel protein [Acidobacteriota bacterium]MCA1641620.1 potassium channel protein [Acidobacteriota bacterium]